MDILLIGYGKMGKAIEALAKERGHHVKLIIDHNNQVDLKALDSGFADVAIEFTQPDSAVSNLKCCVDHGIPVISGTTGWDEQYDHLVEYCREKNGTFLYASNFSLGVNLFFKLNKQLATLMNSHGDYKASMKEVHHTQKKDAPSGTAITLAHDIIRQSSTLTKWSEETANAKGELAIKSERVGSVPGTHIISYTSNIDEIQIKHTAFSRQGFALGAIAVAEWIARQRGVKTMDDFLNTIAV